MKYDFIEIGTSDFRTLAHTVNGRGISVEPVKAYFDNLPDRPDLTRINAGISNENRMAVFYYCKPDVVVAKKLPTWLRGCNSIDIPHPSVVKYCKENGVDFNELVDIDEFQCITLEQLFQDHKVEEVAFLKIDTEGHDYVIMSSLFNLMKADIDGTYKCPLIRKIQYESNALLNDEQRNELLVAAEDIGYSWRTKVERGNEDTILTYNG
jgi:FkbM family methyltransferase